VSLSNDLGPFDKLSECPDSSGLGVRSADRVNGFFSSLLDYFHSQNVVFVLPASSTSCSPITSTSLRRASLPVAPA